MQRLRLGRWTCEREGALTMVVLMRSGHCGCPDWGRTATASTGGWRLAARTATRLAGVEGPFGEQPTTFFPRCYARRAGPPGVRF
jgi:hypothetical protein